MEGRPPPAYMRISAGARNPAVSAQFPLIAPAFPATGTLMSDIALTTESPARAQLAMEVARRRTFAII